MRRILMGHCLQAFMTLPYVFPAFTRRTSRFYTHRVSWTHVASHCARHGSNDSMTVTDFALSKYAQVCRDVTTGLPSQSA
ncbi:hypothetical protein C8Q70DRAFT_987456 [Cubamyces menziesii]|nr:hypothetical protein C8Q70DRAFT_987456 [Cubamyces menziesii]